MLGFPESALGFVLAGIVGGRGCRNSAQQCVRSRNGRGALRRSGRGPHVAFNCTPSAELIASIAQVVMKLREPRMMKAGK